MPRNLTDERRDLVTAIGEFCRKECGTKEQRDKLTDGGVQQHSPQLYAKMAELGWLGIAIPEEYGGAGQGMADLCLFLEETSYWRAPISGFATTIIAAASYEKFATEEQKRVVLGGVVNGRVEAISMSEPGAGSDVAALTCRAERTTGGYVINGQKTWCSNAHLADHVLLVARTSQEADRHQGLTQFMVPTDVDGLQIRGIDTMGGKEVNDLYFTDCFVPDSAVVGTPGNAWAQLMAGLNLERMILAANMYGLARRAFDDILAYVKEREQFGRPIGSFQALKHRIADLATELECARLLLDDVAATIDAHPGEVFAREASMAKLKCTELAKHMTLEGMQMMGGYGYATEYGMESLHRASIVSTVYGGTSEIQRDIIGKTYGL
ncbi:acyl-CoA dehydrogenase family protein [Saccharopolyspora hordei]|uniref:Alkylation response protein AidB-like acyl-CoA dehydrogenase n=1 Tax=Saccharopolyspora hordei TaxID=1838 RepID=A0A853AR69_9PSEU|nr:acyl-CoA dehydrogenase family protein [Saccharopolyspora hordei]NYI83571.1 alkylation response protein AidB-like acyl-CoA dehydrogenase [Saccharopolyspora hordei]